MTPACPLCGRQPAEPLATLEGRAYWRCGRCALRFLDPAQRPSPAAEAAVYRRHENDPDDPGYRRFLARLAEALLARLAPASRGLDYGCGPASAAAAMLGEAGHAVALYDPLFRPDAAVLTGSYDFVLLSEVAEHFHRPAEEFRRLAGLLRPGGLIAVMTCFQTDDARFAGWHYRRDPTHVCFWREETFRWLAAQRGWSCEVPRKDVAILRM